MGEIADQMINGEICAECGVYLEPNEKVWAQEDEEHLGLLLMPKDGTGAGFPVICSSCSYI